MARITYTGAQLDAAIRKVKSGFADVSNVDAQASDVRLGKKIVNSLKQEIVGTMPETNIFTTVTVDADFISDTESDYGLLITPIASVDNPGYVSGASEGLPVTKYIKTESKIITPSDEMQEILPSAGKLLSKVIVRAADNVRPTLYAPSISLSGSILTITDMVRF